MPKAQLKAIQRRILHEILDRIPPHDAAHGFRSKRSIVSYVQPHVGRRIVLHFDLRDFYASVSAPRVQAIFRTAGYPREVARLLAGLCTTRTPDEVAPLRHATEQSEVGDTALFLLSKLGRGITGEVIYVDGGYHILGTLVAIS